MDLFSFITLRKNTFKLDDKQAFQLTFSVNLGLILS